LKKLIRFVVIFAAVIVAIAVANKAVQWFLGGAKDVGTSRTNKSVESMQKSTPAKESPKKD
jgi:hypothetical protein